MVQLGGRLSGTKILVAPGIYDALTAALATTAGARALYLSGAGIAYTQLGRPDIGLVSMSEVAQTIALVRDRVETPLIVDADTGYGNALNVQRTVRAFEQAGADAIQLEDQTFPKRCGHLKDKALVSAAEMVGKIKAAVDARRSTKTQVIARTDAIGVEGFAAALDRAKAYQEAGADILFVEAPASGRELAAIPAALGSIAPLMANMVEGGLTPLHSTSELEGFGYQLVIFPGAVVRMIAWAASELYTTLIAEGSTGSLVGRMHDFDGLNAAIGTPEMLARGKSYEAE